MADQIEDTPVYYEELYDLEREFEDVEVEISESSPRTICDDSF